jgi:aerobic carbon-monoxide dehydrogenase large subunit
MKPMKFGIGQAVKRVEDSRLITGHGQYTADYAPAGALQAVFLRSPHAHAHFTVTNIDAAKSMPGVRAVLVAADFEHLGDLPCLAPLPHSDGQMMKTPPYAVMAKDAVRHVGDIVAMVVAETEAQAREAAEAIEIDWDPQPASVLMEPAIAKGAPAVWEEVPDNVALDTHIGDKAKTDAAFAAAAHVVSLKVINNRLIANYMEPRGAVGEYDRHNHQYTLLAGSQGVHGLRDTLAEKILKVPADKVRVITHDVGGGFGTKSFMYREYPLVLQAAKQLDAPVRWIGDRSEHFVGDAQGRDNVTTAEMALDNDGHFLAMRVDILGNLGAYLSQFAPYIPWLGASMATGTYHIPQLHARVRGIYTHTLPVDAYRGAGRPEAAYVLERLVDTCARKLNMPREEIRAKNFIKSSQMPYKTLTDRTYDVGDFEGAMRASLAKAEYAHFEHRAAEAGKAGKLRGFGFSSYIECTAWGAGEEGSVALDNDGNFTVLIGTQSNGQGHETAYAQVVSQYLDVPLERIKVVQGDTKTVATGNGTGGSRSIPVGSAMLARASEKLAVQLKELAADKLEVAVADLEIADGAVRIAGTDRSISYEEIAKSSEATPEKLMAIDSFTPPEATYPNGTHCCEVEIDPETGNIRIVRYSVVDDFGMTLNPLLLAGQVHGGITQGIGQALMEHTVFSDEGQLLTASFMDYCMPRALDLPDFHFETRNIPSTTNPLGLKGAGEAGSIGSCPAVMNAVVDALHRGFGITHIDMPATPLAVFSAIHGAGGHHATPARASQPSVARATVPEKTKRTAPKAKIAPAKSPAETPAKAAPAKSTLNATPANAAPAVATPAKATPAKATPAKTAPAAKPAAQEKAMPAAPAAKPKKPARKASKAAAPRRSAAKKPARKKAASARPAARKPAKKSPAGRKAVSQKAARKATRKAATKTIAKKNTSRKAAAKKTVSKKATKKTSLSRNSRVSARNASRRGKSSLKRRSPRR